MADWEKCHYIFIITLMLSYPFPFLKIDSVWNARIGFMLFAIF